MAINITISCFSGKDIDKQSNDLCIFQVRMSLNYFNATGLTSIYRQTTLTILCQGAFEYKINFYNFETNCYLKLWLTFFYE
jgi:hypothetical protein